MATLTSWIQAFRLRTLPLSLSGIIGGSSVAIYHGFWESTIFILAICTTLFLQILSNLANDLGDSLKGADNDGRVGPKRTVQTGLISINEMKVAVILFSILSISSATPLIAIGTQNLPSSILWSYIFLAIACVIAAITYTVGKKAYGYSGLGDLFVFIFFGLVSVLGVYSLYSKTFSLPLIFLAISFGLLSAAVLNLNNMRDHVNDKKVGKNTLVVKLGFANAKIYHIALIFFAFLSLCLYLIFDHHTIGWTSTSAFVILFFHLRKTLSTSDPEKLDPELKKVALSTFLISVLLMLSTLL
jgi:1,4-dihydroxy-2-naphthoate octaprenyltransferase